MKNLTLRYSITQFTYWAASSGIASFGASRWSMVCGCTLRAVSDNAKRFKFITIWVYNIAIINVNDRFRRNPLF